MSWRLVALKLRPNPLVMMVHRWRSLKQRREAKSQNPVFGTRWDSSRGRQLIWQIKQTGGRQKKKKKSLYHHTKLESSGIWDKCAKKTSKLSEIFGFWGILTLNN